MDPNNNSFPGVSPLQGAPSATPSTASASTPTQGMKPIDNGLPSAGPNLQHGDTPVMSQMPNMTETLNMAAAKASNMRSDVSAGNDNLGMNNGVSLESPGIGTSSPASLTNIPTNQNTFDSADTNAVPTINADNASDGVVGAFSVPDADVNHTPAAPIARPTNIDGINSVRASSVPTGNTRADNVANPFTNPTTPQTPNVSFSDPADQPAIKAENSISSRDEQSQKKKSSKTVLIVLSVIAFIVAIALAVILVMEVMGVGPFATGNNSGQTTAQSQNSNNNSETSNNANNNSNNGSSNSNGSSGNNGSSNNNSNGVSNNGSGSNDENGGSASTVATATPGSIVCYNTTTDTDVTVESEIVFAIDNNKMTTVTINSTATDINGNTYEMSDSGTFNEIVDGMAEDGNYIERDGTLKVTAQELAISIEEELGSEMGELSCIVK